MKFYASVAHKVAGAFLIIINEVTLPDGVTVKSYSGNKATNVGEYTAKVSFNYDETIY